jgi:hypothetical protein
MARPAYKSGSDDMKILSVLLIATCWLNAGRLHGQEQWFKGNTHTHTFNSDGDSTPDEVVRWYRLHRYDFLFITDHDMVTNVDPLNALFSGGDQFLVLSGEEVTANRRSPPLAVHVNALGVTQRIEARQAATARETLQANLNAINDAIQKSGSGSESGSGIAQINHPNFLWQLTADDIAALKGATLMEIMNMHPLVNSFGAGPAAPSAERMWDQVLSRGVAIWGVASDDEHEMKEGGLAGSAGSGAMAGKGWITVRAQHLTKDEILDAIKRGDFYASTGVELTSFTATQKEIDLEISDKHPAFRTRYQVEFIGKGGAVLQESGVKEQAGLKAQYRMTGNEGYVRVRITDSNGHRAWTQPVFVHPVSVR